MAEEDLFWQLVRYESQFLSEQPWPRSIHPSCRIVVSTSSIGTNGELEEVGDVQGAAAGFRSLTLPFVLPSAEETTR